MSFENQQHWKSFNSESSIQKSWKYQRPRKSSERGFTLVEISIVLVIVGLLIGSILVGAEMIHASKVRSIATDSNNYITAINVFTTKYFQVPGDMRNATEFWGVSSGGCPNGVGTGTCNGNGNRILTDGGADQEMHRFWQHLALAALIPGEYTGVAGPGSTVNAVIGVNAPGSRISGVGFTAINMGINSPGAPYLYPGDYSQCFQIGIQGNYQTENPFLTPSEAYSIDAKFDDAHPAKGNFLMRNNLPFSSGGNPLCTDSNASNAENAKYLQSNSDVACALLVCHAW